MTKLIGIDDNYGVDIGIGIVGGLAFMMLTASTSISIGSPAIYPQTTLPAIVNAAAALVVVGLLAPIFEEAVFRGVVFSFTKSIMSVVGAIVVTGLAFSFTHWMAYGEALTAAFVGAFVFSTIACLMVLATNSIIGPIVMHGMVNVWLYLQSNQLFGVTG